MLDQSTGDHLLTRADVAEMLANLGQPNDEAALDRLFVDADTPRSGINFTQFLTMFGEHLCEMDDAETLLEAFECFDDKDEGVIDVAELRKWLGEVGDRMSDHEVR